MNNSINSCKKNSQFGGCTTVTSTTISQHFDVQSLLKLLQYDLGCGCIVFHIIITKMSYICMVFLHPHCTHSRAKKFNFDYRALPRREVQESGMALAAATHCYRHCCATCMYLPYVMCKRRKLEDSHEMSLPWRTTTFGRIAGTPRRW